MNALSVGFSFAICSRHCLVSSTDDTRRDRSASPASAMVTPAALGSNTNAESASGAKPRGLAPQSTQQLIHPRLRLL